MLYQKILEEYDLLQTRIQEIQEEIGVLPEGKLICSRGNNCYKWYQTINHSRTYIPKSNRTLAEQLAVKKYLSLTLEYLLKEKTALEFYLRHHSENPNQAEQLLRENPGYQDLLAPYFKPKSETHQIWMDTPYPQNTKFPENLVHKTSAGIYVRSKSEAMITLFLHTHGIPFRYECMLNLGTTAIYPDFTILHPETSKIYYWEHFGMMDNSNYVQNACSKLQLYSANGIIPSIQLITTYETKDHPLSYEEISWVASHYFL